jgi:hypothetical protein
MEKSKSSTWAKRLKTKTETETETETETKTKTVASTSTSIALKGMMVNDHPATCNESGGATVYVTPCFTSGVSTSYCPSGYFSTKTDYVDASTA